MSSEIGKPETGVADRLCITNRARQIQKVLVKLDIAIEIFDKFVNEHHEIDCTKTLSTIINLARLSTIIN